MTLHQKFGFVVTTTCENGRARAGLLNTAQGPIETPVFMPVATQAAVRGLPTEHLVNLKFPILLANTYHLLLRPGPEVFRHFGGIHQFMNWPGAILTDSGGYQIFSLSRQLKMSEEGAQFRSYVDGKSILLTPETSIETQTAIGSNIMMVLDQCLPAGAPRPQVAEALSLTTRWARRSLAARQNPQQALFAIVQGGCFKELRQQSAEELTALSFDGFAVGGVAVGEEKNLRDEVVAFTTQFLPKDKPRYLMGVGTPLDILEGVRSGIDMFDCILPMAWAQQGGAFSKTGKIDLRRTAFRLDDNPLENDCRCFTCQNYSKAYLHHLNKTGEFLAGTFIGIHNLHFYKTLMQNIRQAILQQSFESFYRQMKEEFIVEPTPPPTSKKNRRKLPELLGNYQLSREEKWTSVLHRSSGEIMHSVSDPIQEAHSLYVDQSFLIERLKRNATEPVILWDVGLGAATNAMAAIHTYEKTASAGANNLAPLRIISFENDLDSLRLALHHPHLFTHLRHQAPHAMIGVGKWTSPKFPIEWILIQGDFFETHEAAPQPDIIYYDLFSYKVNSRMWSFELFEKIFRKLKSGETELFTYTVSTPARAALLAAGFYVAKGKGSGPKTETTIALSGPSNLPWTRDLLGVEWLSRWERSDRPLPADILDNVEEMKNRIRLHPQFSNAINNFDQRIQTVG